MKRVFDIVLSSLLVLILLGPLLLIALLVKITSVGPILYASDRVGKNNNFFVMYKFRTMKIDTPPVATHLMVNPQNYLTPVGAFLRKTSLDEIPQLINILRGDMSFVGPRPALFNQYDLIDLRTKSGVHTLVPGLTGWAQIHGRDELQIPTKVEFDTYYLNKNSLSLDIRILFLTFLKVLGRKDVHH